MEEDTMLLVAFTGRADESLKNKLKNSNFDLNQLNGLFRGRCFLKIKSTELEKLETDVNQLYHSVYPNGKKDPLLGVALPESE
jgi:hypothetical protein